MANFDVSITDNTDEVKNALPEQIERALIAIGFEAERHAKQALTDQKAVDTGRLRGSVTNIVEIGEQSVYIGTNVEYAAFVELGTSRMAPRPYLRPAATQHTEEYRQLLEAALNDNT